MENVNIDWLAGFCPVQAEGTIDGLPFYFRARGRRWRIGIGGDRVMNPMWGYGELYGTGPFDAGWMSEDEALVFIEKAVGLYRSGHPTTDMELLVRQPDEV
ncbi:hypothetical protein OIU34_24695 [Pararhizobium sp. BT-229]|uniref:hypothetical protein n=1 Tax=Pararhizobium sp. BT-229 TaxID=2986923 RepID=UPI0021F786FC|nr:hypothetical protein [Pararhizobium sp. BT-229]MCV9965101.1 hypothetical protein [Pararhizobium sp. BT-229]